MVIEYYNQFIPGSESEVPSLMTSFGRGSHNQPEVLGMAPDCHL